MELNARHIKPLEGESDWGVWKRGVWKVRDLLDYHEGCLDVLDAKVVKPEPLEATASQEVKAKYANDAKFYRKADSHAKTVLTSARLTQCTGKRWTRSQRMKFGSHSKSSSRHPHRTKCST